MWTIWVKLKMIVPPAQRQDHRQELPEEEHTLSDNLSGLRANPCFGTGPCEGTIDSQRHVSGRCPPLYHSLNKDLNTADAVVVGKSTWCSGVFQSSRKARCSSNSHVIIFLQTLVSAPREIKNVGHKANRETLTYSGGEGG